MSMKKIIAGVAAAALTVGSLAVVGVSADETKTFNFVGLDGSMNISYSKTIGFRGGIKPDNLFALTNNPSSYEFNYGLKLSMKSGYKDDNLGDVNNALSSIKTSGGTKITVTGTNKAGRTISTSCTTKVLKNSKDEPVEETFNIRWEGDEGDPTLVAEDLDLTYFETITAIEASTSFSVSTGNFYVPEGVCNVAVSNDLRLEDSRVDMDGSGSYKSESKENKGYVIDTSKIYTFEGVNGHAVDILDNNGSWYAPVTGESLGYNLLRWTNDNIVQKKGAKLRINFMTPDEMKNAISAGAITSYPTLDADWAKWQGSTVLVPETSGSAATQDIVIGVNLHNTTKLQQTTNIVNYTAEFDWDTLVQNSAATISGNVDSIAFRVNGDSTNVKDTVADKATKSKVAIKSIEIVIPEQQEAANEPTRILTAGSGDTFVKVIGTDKTIFGNGAQELAVDNSITTNNVKYSLKLTDANGAYVQPAGELTLQLSIPADFRGKTLSSSTVRHTCNDGTVEELAIQNMDSYKTDNYIVVKTSKFSSFVFSFEGEEETTTEAPAETTTEAPVETTTEAPVETTAPVADTNNGGADKNANTGVVLAVVPAAIAAAAVVISKKRK